jgi:hypothetical protein
MYIVNNEITITWVLGPTATPLLASDFDISFLPSDHNATYTDDAISNYVPPTADNAGSLTYAFTPLFCGRYRILLTKGTSAAFEVLDEKDFYVYQFSPTSLPSTEVLGNRALPPPVHHLNITQFALPVVLYEEGIDDDFQRAFTLTGGTIDDTLTEYEVIAYNDTDTADGALDELPAPFIVGDGTDGWYDIGTGPFTSTNIDFDVAGNYNGPSVGTYTGVGPWTGVTVSDSATSNGHWYYVKVTIWLAGQVEGSINYCYAQSEAV